MKRRYQQDDTIGLNAGTDMAIALFAVVVCMFVFVANQRNLKAVELREEQSMRVQAQENLKIAMQRTRSNTIDPIAISSAELSGLYQIEKSYDKMDQELKDLHHQYDQVKRNLEEISEKYIAVNRRNSELRARLQRSVSFDADSTRSVFELIIDIWLSTQEIESNIIVMRGYYEERVKEIESASKDLVDIESGVREGDQGHIRSKINTIASTRDYWENEIALATQKLEHNLHICSYTIGHLSTVRDLAFEVIESHKPETIARRNAASSIRNLLIEAEDSEIELLELIRKEFTTH